MLSYLYNRKTVVRDTTSSHPTKNRSTHSDQSRIAFFNGTAVTAVFFGTKRHANGVIWEPSSNSLIRSPLILVSHHTRPD